MSNIEYRKGNLFSAPKGVMLLHACNCQGRWGSGIALQFYHRFPQAYLAYNKHCLAKLPRDRNERSPLVGSHLVVEEKGYGIGCLFTSNAYAQRVDPPNLIVESTARALKSLFADPRAISKYPEIHSPKINSNLFRVPWDKTEAVIREHLPKDVRWIVWELD